MMAMTKKERAEMDAAILRAETVAALRWTAPVRPDLPAPKDHRERTQGWNFNAHARRVYEAWSECFSHGDGLRPVGPYRSASQGGVALYSTRALASAAMRHEVELMCAEWLRQIDHGMLAHAVGGPDPYQSAMAQVAENMRVVDAEMASGNVEAAAWLSRQTMAVAAGLIATEHMYKSICGRAHAVGGSTGNGGGND